MSYEETIYRADKKGEERGTIKGTVETCFAFGKTFEETITFIIGKFTLTPEEAQEYVSKYRPAAAE